MAEADARWYVAHTYSGYEKKVKANIEKTIENRKLQDQILEVSVPLESVIEVKDGKEKEVQRKLFPGYVLINMIMNDDTWYVVRNTRGVTGFVGPGSKPVPLTEEEMRNMGLRRDQEIVYDIAEGDMVQVVSGPWEKTTGVVRFINHEKKCLTISIELNGREAPIEIGLSDVRAVN